MFEFTPTGSQAKFSTAGALCLYVCCCRARGPRARRRREFRSPGGGAGCHRRPICVAWRGLLITCLSTRGFVIQRRPPLTTPNHPRRQHRHHTNITWWSIRARSWWLRSWPLIGVSMHLPGTRDTTDQTPPRDDDRKPQTLMWRRQRGARWWAPYERRGMQPSTGYRGRVWGGWVERATGPDTTAHRHPSSHSSLRTTLTLSTNGASHCPEPPAC